MTKETSYRFPLRVLIACVMLGAVLAMQSGEPAAQEPIRESEACLDCHDGQDATLAGTVHVLGGGGSASGIACTDCHGTNSAHWEEDPEENPMINPSGLGAAAEAKQCASCHETSHQQNMLERNVHARNEINCSGCHSVHSSDEHTALLKEEETELCHGCHRDIEGELARSYRHPVSDGVVKCTECHMTLDETSSELSLNGTNVCAKCHGEFQGPFPFEHQATLDYSTEEGGCLTCHAPHGSDHPRMLNQPYEPPHFQLCTQCHFVPSGHNLNPMHGTRWAGLACNTCHTDIHGSYTNRFFLSESLRAEGCLNGSCHGHY